VRPRQCSVCLSHDQRLKFKTSPLESGPQPPSILVDGNAVDSLSTFTYLGSLQSSDGYCRPDVRRRITLASSVMLSLDCIWKERRLPLPIKIGLRVDLALVQSVLLYASETWTVTSADAKSLEAFHMKCQRRILIISWRQFVRNSEILRSLVYPPSTTSSDIVASLSLATSPDCRTAPQHITHYSLTSTSHSVVFPMPPAVVGPPGLVAHVAVGSTKSETTPTRHLPTSGNRLLDAVTMDERRDGPCTGYAMMVMTDDF